jgi:hypothetical protein
MRSATPVYSLLKRQARERQHLHAMIDGMFNQLRGIDKWPSTTATVSSTEIVGTGGKSGRTMNIYFDYNPGSATENGKFFVDDNSSLYGLAQGEQFSIQFSPKRPSHYYCSEATSLSQTIRRGIISRSSIRGHRVPDRVFRQFKVVTGGASPNIPKP